MRKEIEVKAKVKNIQEIAERLLSLNCVISAPQEQKDIIFTNFDDKLFAEFQSGINLLRIRESGGKALFTVKQPQSNEQDAIEYETEIGDAAQMAEALKVMGYHEAVKVIKKRRITKYKEYEICLDEVDGLGSFIEMEIITESDDAEKIQDEMFYFLMSLGVKKDERVTQGYDTLVYLNKK